MPYTNVDAANQALSLLGVNAISAIDNTTEEGTEAGRFYDDVKNALLVKRPWRWAMKTAQLVAAADPSRGWDKAHDLPADLIKGGYFILYPDDGEHQLPVKSFEIYGADVRSNYDTLWADYVYDADEDDWPGDFRRLFYHALAAEMALPLTEKRSKREDLARIAWGPPSENGNGGLFATAALADSQRRPIRGLAETSSPLLAARQGRGNRFY